MDKPASTSELTNPFAAIELAEGQRLVFALIEDEKELVVWSQYAPTFSEEDASEVISFAMDGLLECYEDPTVGVGAIRDAIEKAWHGFLNDYDDEAPQSFRKVFLDVEEEANIEAPDALAEDLYNDFMDGREHADWMELSSDERARWEAVACGAIARLTGINVSPSDEPESSRPAGESVAPS